MVSDEMTKKELQDELRRRGLPVSGTRGELRERLQDAEGEREDGSASSDTQPRGDGQGGNDTPSRPPRAAEMARLAARQLASLTRREVEAISGLARDEDGWRVEVEVVEVHRVPSSTDVLGTYAVWVDDEGELVSYERVERFVRGQSGGGEG